MDPRPELLPVIVSASRATDIPAFQGDWLAERLKEGFCHWRNPFNNAVSKVSFEKTRFFVFWTKNPAPFIKHLKLFDERRLGYCFQFTLNNYDPEGLEPCVPPLKERIETFARLSDMLGPERVIWRFDPIILSDKLRPSEAVERIGAIGGKLKGLTKRLVISFADIERYKAAKRRLGSAWSEPSEDEIHEIASKLSELNKSLGLEISTCAESVELELYGIAHSRCIDGGLISRLAPDAAELQSHLRGAGKDKGQRKDCLCVKSKDIGSYGTCRHGCLYCYAAR